MQPDCTASPASGGTSVVRAPCWRRHIAAAGLLALALSGCGGTGTQPEPPTPTASPTTSASPSPSGTLAAALRDAADDVLTALRDEDYDALAGIVDPVAGVRFSPYAFVDIDSDIVLSTEEAVRLGADDTVRNWGSFDGSGDPIAMTFADYRKRFIWDHDYLEAEQVASNTPIGSGNTINNLAEAYPGDSFVEYHFPGFDPQYAGMDWRSLRVVLRPQSDGWTLVGIVHDEWTI